MQIGIRFPNSIIPFKSPIYRLNIKGQTLTKYKLIYLKVYERFEEQWLPFTVFYRAYMKDEMIMQALEMF